MNTSQEEFWKGDFGDQYIERNISPELLAANLHFFARITQNIEINSSCEVGCNAGMNLKALSLLIPGSIIDAVEINSRAADLAKI